MTKGCRPLHSMALSSQEPAEKRVQTQHVDQGQSKVMFIELFADKALLTRAVRRVGLTTSTPQDMANGGANFLVEEEVQDLRRQWKSFKDQGYSLIFM